MRSGWSLRNPPSCPVGSEDSTHPTAHRALLFRRRTMQRRDQLSTSSDGIDRRDMLKCMAWVGTGLLWTVSGGVPSGRLFGQGAKGTVNGEFSFVQISDSH